MKFLGRGGTDLRPPFDWIRQNLEQRSAPPDALIYLTDGFGPSPEKAPSYPTVWIMPTHSANALPFGQIIQFETFQEAA